MRELWATISHDEREAIRTAVHERINAKNAEHAYEILRELPVDLRDSVIARLRDLPR